MSMLLQKTSYCPAYELYKKRAFHRYDLDFWRCLLEEWEEPNVVDLKANLGKQIVSNLPSEFTSKNHGRFIAVTFSGKILSVCDTLKALNQEIAKKDMKENYYIARIGYRTISQI